MHNNQNYHFNKLAFDEVIEWYINLKSAGSVKILDFDDSGPGGAPNRAKPNTSDFFCDVENAIEATIRNNYFKILFDRHYIHGVECLDLSQQARIEQMIGKVFRKRKLSPVPKYFTVIRK